ncbi:MAG: CPBP family intramembrane metalloprotease [Microbacteriaceae bacterium]|nr:CPBP family intramembrane metalloprotease [Microbacteriaceae bacterium]
MATDIAARPEEFGEQPTHGRPWGGEPERRIKPRQGPQPLPRRRPQPRAVRAGPGPRPGLLDLSLFDSLAPADPGTLLAVATIGRGIEEPGWRGFTLPALQQRRSPLIATLTIGLGWGIWHIPLSGPLCFIAPLVLAFFSTWLYNRTGSVVVCLVLHASFTPAQDYLTLVPDAAIVDAVILGTYVAVPLALTVATRGHLGHPRSTAESQLPPQHPFTSLS